MNIEQVSGIGYFPGFCITEFDEEEPFGTTSERVSTSTQGSPLHSPPCVVPDEVADDKPNEMAKANDSNLEVNPNLLNQTSITDQHGTMVGTHEINVDQSKQQNENNIENINQYYNQTFNQANYNSQQNYNQQIQNQQIQPDQYNVGQVLHQTQIGGTENNVLNTNYSNAVFQKSMETVEQMNNSINGDQDYEEQEDEEFSSEHSETGKYGKRKGSNSGGNKNRKVKKKTNVYQVRFKQEKFKTDENGRYMLPFELDGLKILSIGSGDISTSRGNFCRPGFVSIRQIADNDEVIWQLAMVGIDPKTGNPVHIMEGNGRYEFGRFASGVATRFRCSDGQLSGPEIFGYKSPIIQELIQKPELISPYTETSISFDIREHFVYYEETKCQRMLRQEIPIPRIGLKKKKSTKHSSSEDEKRTTSNQSKTLAIPASSIKRAMANQPGFNFVTNNNVPKQNLNLTNHLRTRLTNTQSDNNNVMFNNNNNMNYYNQNMNMPQFRGSQPQFQQQQQQMVQVPQYNQYPQNYQYSNRNTFSQQSQPLSDLPLLSDVLNIGSQSSTDPAELSFKHIT